MKHKWYCPKCGFLIKGKGNQTSHLTRCNGTGPVSSIPRRTGGKGWKRGLVYKDIYGNREKDIRKKIGKSLSNTVSEERKTPEYREKMSRRMKGKTGGWRIGGGRGKGSWYVSPTAGRVYLDSTWELAYAKWLDNNGVNWKRNKIKFPYEWEGIERYYIPDFFLVETKKYIEIKGYKTEKDIAKWKSFPYTLEVLMKPEMKTLGLI